MNEWPVKRIGKADIRSAGPVSSFRPNSAGRRSITHAKKQTFETRDYRQLRANLGRTAALMGFPIADMTTRRPPAGHDVFDRIIICMVNVRSL